MKILRHAPYLCVADMQRSLAFYRDGLGLTVQSDSTGDDGLFLAVETDTEPEDRFYGFPLHDPDGYFYAYAPLLRA